MSLGPEQKLQMAAPLDGLRREGPRLGGSLAKLIKGSRHHNMKELRSVGRNMRALFIFGPDQRAIVLVGGDKTNNWKRWYDENIPLAEKLYENHLRSLGKEGPSPARSQRHGARSEHSSR